MTKDARGTNDEHIPAKNLSETSYGSVKSEL